MGLPLQNWAIEAFFPKDLTMKFGEKGESYITGKLLFQGQVRNKEGKTDLLLRRTHLLLYGDITPYFTYFVDAGVTPYSSNQTTGEHPNLRLYDLTGEANISSYCKVGFGLHAWNGISRLSSGTVLSQLMLDPSGVHNPMVGCVNNIVMRQIGIFARGQVQKFNYQIAFNHPFKANLLPDIENITTDMAQYIKTDTWSYQGYFSYSFADTEQQVLSFSAVNLLGAKKIINVGAGIYYQPDCMASLIDEQLTLSDHIFSGIDVYVDMPILKNDRGTGAVSFYSVGYYYHYGKNYIYLDAAKNPLVGNGFIWHSQAGFLIPPFFNPKFGQLQPFASHSTKWLSSLTQTTNQIDWGINWLVRKHFAKITFQHSILPKVENLIKTSTTHHFVLQLQLFL